MTATLPTETRPGYKQTKLGWIPEEWEVVRLKRLIDLKSGQHILAEDYSNGPIGTPYVTGPSDFCDKGLHITKWTTNPKVVAQKGDLLITVKGSGCGRIAVSQIDRVAISRQLMAIKAKEGLDDRYMFYQIKRSERKLNHESIGNLIPGLGRSEINGLRIPLPPLPEQQRIAAILGTWDRAIGQLEDLLAAKETQLKGLMQRLLTGAVRLAGFEGAWEEVRLGQILKESKDVGLGADPSMRLTVKLNLKGVTNRAVRGTEVEGATIYYRRKAGQFIYGKQNLHKGALGLIPSEYDGYESSSDIPSFDFKAGYDPTYFVMYVSRPNFYEHLEVLATGTGSKRIKPRVLLKKTVNIPTLKEQKAIAGVLSAGQTELQLLYQKLAGLREQQRGLMARLLTGAVRV